MRRRRRQEAGQKPLAKAAGGDCEAFGAWSMNAGLDHFFTVAVPVSRPDESRKVMVLPLTVLVPVMRPDESR
jgi:hypothetical protein